MAKFEKHDLRSVTWAVCPSASCTCVTKLGVKQVMHAMSCTLKTLISWVHLHTLFYILKITAQTTRSPNP